MPKIESTIMVNRPLTEVFKFVADPANTPQWQQAVSEAGFAANSSLKEGATIRQMIKRNGQPMESVSKITRLEPDRELVYEPVTAADQGVTQMSHRFATEGDGTRVSCLAEMTEASLKASHGEHQKSLDADYASLKKILEA
ncbi:MAG: SRPBCC domain-containing protein [Thermaerobacterales bacterium]